MSNTNFWKGVILGAIAGGCVSLLDRTTRTSVLGSCQRTTRKITYYVKHPQEAIDGVKESTRKIRSTIEEVSEEVSFIAEKIDELKEITPQVADIVRETKDTFADNHSDEKKERTAFQA